MALQTDYTFSGLQVQNAYLRIDRLWGSSRENWNALVGVYNQVIIDGQAELKKITEFNHSCAFKVDERGYTSLYASLQSEYGGEEI